MSRNKILLIINLAALFFWIALYYVSRYYWYSNYLLSLLYWIILLISIEVLVLKIVRANSILILSVGFIILGIVFHLFRFFQFSEIVFEISFVQMVVGVFGSVLEKRNDEG